MQLSEMTRPGQKSWAPWAAAGPRSSTSPPEPLLAAMPSVWVSAQCVVEADEVRIMLGHVSR